MQLNGSLMKYLLKYLQLVIIQLEQLCLT